MTLSRRSLLACSLSGLLTVAVSCGSGSGLQPETVQALLIESLTRQPQLANSVRPGNLEKAIKSNFLADKYQFTTCTAQVEQLELEEVHDQTQVYTCYFLVTGQGALRGFAPQGPRSIPNTEFSVQDLRLKAVVTVNASGTPRVADISSGPDALPQKK